MSATSSRRAPERTPYLLSLPFLLFLSAFFVVPVIQMMLLSVMPEEGAGLSFDLFASVVSDPYYHRVAIRTLRISLVTTLVSLVLAFPVALFMSHVSPRWQTVLVLIMVSPLLTSVVVRTLAWVVLLSQRGIINQMLQALGMEPVRLIYVESAIVIGLTHVFFGYMVVPLMTSIRRIDGNLYAAAANLGASRWRQHLEITLPLSLPGVLTGSLLVFILSASAYATPSLLGGLQISMLAVEVYNQAITMFDWPEAAVVSTVLFVMIAAVVAFFTRVLEGGRRRVTFQ
jgi:putative spermidine/putrescine transport system permease protein